MSKLPYHHAVRKRLQRFRPRLVPFDRGMRFDEHPRPLRHALEERGSRERHLHRTVTARSQHGHSTVTAQTESTERGPRERHGHSTVTARSQHGYSTVTARSQHRPRAGNAARVSGTFDLVTSNQMYDADP